MVPKPQEKELSEIALHQIAAIENSAIAFVGVGRGEEVLNRVYPPKVSEEDIQTMIKFGGRIAQSGPSVLLPILGGESFLPNLDFLEAYIKGEAKNIPIPLYMADMVMGARSLFQSGWSLMMQEIQNIPSNAYRKIQPGRDDEQAKQARIDYAHSRIQSRFNEAALSHLKTVTESTSSFLSAEGPKNIDFATIATTLRFAMTLIQPHFQAQTYYEMADEALARQESQKKTLYIQQQIATEILARRVLNPALVSSLNNQDFLPLTMTAIKFSITENGPELSLREHLENRLAELEEITAEESVNQNIIIMINSTIALLNAFEYYAKVDARRKGHLIESEANVTSASQTGGTARPLEQEGSKAQGGPTAAAKEFVRKQPDPEDINEQFKIAQNLPRVTDQKAKEAYARHVDTILHTMAKLAEVEPDKREPFNKLLSAAKRIVQRADPGEFAPQINALIALFVFYPPATSQIKTFHALSGITNLSEELAKKFIAEKIATEGSFTRTTLTYDNNFALDLSDNDVCAYINRMCENIRKLVSESTNQEAFFGTPVKDEYITILYAIQYYLAYLTNGGAQVASVDDI